MVTGLVHLYFGDGKGKTTAAVGLGLRALGRGLRVSIVQFLKDGSSGEVQLLKNAGGIVYTGLIGRKFVFQMDVQERDACKQRHNAILHEAMEAHADVLILDEALGALETGMLDEALLMEAVNGCKGHAEVILTGRNPAPWMLETADYITEMKCCRHPYDSGIAARVGIEY